MLDPEKVLSPLEMQEFQRSQVKADVLRSTYFGLVSIRRAGVYVTSGEMDLNNWYDSRAVQLFYLICAAEKLAAELLEGVHVARVQKNKEV